MSYDKHAKNVIALALAFPLGSDWGSISARRILCPFRQVPVVAREMGSRIGL